MDAGRFLEMQTKQKAQQIGGNQDIYKNLFRRSVVFSHHSMPKANFHICGQ